MEITPEKLDAAGVNILLVRSAVLRAIAAAPKPFYDEADLKVAMGSTFDGILHALAWIIAGSGQYESMKDRRRLADQCRDGLLKFIKAAQAAQEAGEDWEVGPEGKPN